MKNKCAENGLYNKTKQIKIVERVVIGSNWWRRMKGLLGRRNYPNQALVIMPCQQVHTMFMMFPIDILYIDERNEVIAKDTEVKPWMIGKKYSQAIAVIEAESGSFGDERVQIGDVLSY